MQETGDEGGKREMIKEPRGAFEEESRMRGLGASFCFRARTQPILNETIPPRTNSTEYKAITAAKWLYLRDIRPAVPSRSPSEKQKNRYKAEKERARGRKRKRRDAA